MGIDRRITCSSHPPTHPPTHQPTNPQVHFWAPSFKWGISLANIADMSRPPELISVPQQCGESGSQLASQPASQSVSQSSAHQSRLSLTRIPFPFPP